MNWMTVVGAAVAGLTGSALVAFIQGFFSRRTVKADAADRLTESAVDWAASLKADAADARKEAAEARTEAKGARRELAEVHRQMAALADEVEAVTQRLRYWRTAILHPDANLDRLRAMVDADSNPQANGRF